MKRPWLIVVSLPLALICSRAYAPLRAPHLRKSVAQWREEATSPDDGKKLEAIRSLMFYGKAAAPAIPTLRTCLASPSPRVRGAALDALAWIYRRCFEHGSDKRSEDELAKALSDSHKHVRFAAAMALRDLAEYSAVALPELRAHLADEDGQVRHIVKEAIAAIKKQQRN